MGTSDECAGRRLMCPFFVLSFDTHHKRIPILQFSKLRLLDIKQHTAVTATPSDNHIGRYRPRSGSSNDEIRIVFYILNGYIST